MSGWPGHVADTSTVIFLFCLTNHSLTLDGLSLRSGSSHYDETGIIDACDFFKEQDVG